MAMEFQFSPFPQAPPYSHRSFVSLPGRHHTQHTLTATPARARLCLWQLEIMAASLDPNTTCRVVRLDRGDVLLEVRASDTYVAAARAARCPEPLLGAFVRVSALLGARLLF